MTFGRVYMTYSRIGFGVALLLAAFVSPARAGDMVVFPPENAAECKPGSALTWGGKASGQGVRCTDLAPPPEVQLYAMTCSSAIGRSKTFISAPLLLGNETPAEAINMRWLATDAPSGQSTWLVQINVSTGEPVNTKLLNCYETGVSAPPAFRANADCLTYGIKMGQSLSGDGKSLASCSYAYIISASLPAR